VSERFSRWERFYARVMGYWPQSVVDRRLAEYERGRDAAVAEAVREHQERMARSVAE
jgi:hypothetical protein